MICRMIAPPWKIAEGARKAVEGDFTVDQIIKYNEEGYNVYYLPNSPEKLPEGRPVDGTDIVHWDFVFVDFDLKSKNYPSKDDFIHAIGDSEIIPTKVIDSGNGIHVYWKVSDLTPMSFLALSRRLMRKFNTDPAVQKIYQLMRTPGTMNTKVKDHFIPCEILFESDEVYTSEELDQLLPQLTQEDEVYCKEHFDKTYSTEEIDVDEKLPPKFGQLLQKNLEVKEIWSQPSTDRSRDDYRLGHILFANNFTQEEAMSVLVNSAKAISRAPRHRVNYAKNIVDKIWTHELSEDLTLSESVDTILRRPADTLKGTAFRSHRRIDNTVRGYRLGDVIGLVGGSGVGKTAFGLNIFRWCAEENPDYHHFFIPLEQPSNEIAERWDRISGGDTRLNGKIHVMSNYDVNGNFRHLSLTEIREYIEKWQEKTGYKVGCVMVDHIGALKKTGSSDEKQDIIDICHDMKAFAVQLNVLLVMQSQTSREKAGIGDLELNKDAAYGASQFEWYCDYLMTIWQPLKRCASEDTCPSVTAFKYCKIRHKKPLHDVIKEDVPYYFYFDSDKEQLRDMSQDEETAFVFFLKKATNKRKSDRKTELLEYKSVPYKETSGTKLTHN